MTGRQAERWQTDWSGNTTREDWSVDWDYNRGDKSNIFRPWGFQTGHLTEWAKLLLQLEGHLATRDRTADWIVPRARHFFDTAMFRGWDAENGGLVYGFGPDGKVCDADKYFWVQAESFAAAALLAVRTGEASYWDWYDRLWAYSWAHFVDHRHGAWYRILDAAEPEDQRREEPRRQDRLSHHGRVPRRAQGAAQIRTPRLLAEAGGGLA